MNGQNLMFVYFLANCLVEMYTLMNFFISAWFEHLHNCKHNVLCRHLSHTLIDQECINNTYALKADSLND